MRGVSSKAIDKNEGKRGEFMLRLFVALLLVATCAREAGLGELRIADRVGKRILFCKYLGVCQAKS